MHRNIEMRHMPRSKIFESGFDGNVLIAGGLEEVRSELLYSGIVNSCLTNIIIHNLDTRLENKLLPINTYVVSINTANYDPFFLRTDEEIIDLILNSAHSNYNLQLIAGDYIKGMLMYLRSKNITPTVHRLAICPHSKIIKIVKDRINSGLIDGDTGRVIVQKLNRGQSENDKIEKVFRDLDRECSYIRFNPSYSNCFDVILAIKNHKHILFNINGNNCPLLLNMIITQVKMMKQSGYSVRIVLDDVNIDPNSEVIKDLIYKMYTEVVVSGNNPLSLLQNDEKMFKTIYSKSKQKMILSQDDAIIASRISEYVGTYKKKEIKNTIAETKFQLSQPIPFGVPIAHLEEEKDEPKISETELQGLSSDSSFYKEKSLSKWQNIILE